MLTLVSQCTYTYTSIPKDACIFLHKKSSLKVSFSYFLRFKTNKQSIKDFYWGSLTFVNTFILHEISEVLRHFKCFLLLIPCTNFKV